MFCSPSFSLGQTLVPGGPRAHPRHRLLSKHAPWATRGIKHAVWQPAACTDHPRHAPGCKTRTLGNPRHAQCTKTTRTLVHPRHAECCKLRTLGNPQHAPGGPRKPQEGKMQPRMPQEIRIQLRRPHRINRRPEAPRGALRRPPGARFESANNRNPKKSKKIVSGRRPGSGQKPS